jgi:hypothetical protein
MIVSLEGPDKLIGAKRAMARVPFLALGGSDAPAKPVDSLYGPEKSTTAARPSM